MPSYRQQSLKIDSKLNVLGISTKGVLMFYRYKKWFFLTLVLILGLAACAPSSSPADNPATEAPESAPTPEEATAVEEGGSHLT